MFHIKVDTHSEIIELEIKVKVCVLKYCVRTWFAKESHTEIDVVLAVTDVLPAVLQ